MSDRLDELGTDTAVAMITFTDPENLAGYSAMHDLPFPILVDNDRVSYRAYGLGRGSVARVYGWSVARRYLQILRADGVGALSKPTEDTLQLGGDFVIGPDGSLIYGYWGAGPDDRPSVDELIAALNQEHT
ncbi:MAG: AhpC/TSA family protein [Acidimicrobiales bacterium]